MKKTLVLCCLLLLFRVASTAAITFTFVGQVTSIRDTFGLLDGSVAIGTQMFGQFTFATLPADTNPDPGFGQYLFSAPSGFSLSVGSYVFQTAPTPSLRVEVGDQRGFGGGTGSSDVYEIDASPSLVPASPTIFSKFMSIGLLDSTGTVFSSDTLPLTLPDRVAWSEANFFITTNGLVNGSLVDAIDIAGRVHTITAPSADPLPPDADGDGVPDDVDECPNSDLSTTVVIDNCDSGVPNTLFPSGCTISDLIAACAEGASNHGQFVICVSQVTNDLKKAGTITGQQKDAIQRCAAKAHIP